MFNNLVLDVFIGLVLVYLLYSLLVTIISEILATWMGLRSRILRVSIEKMLNDGAYGPTGTISFIQRFFLKEFDEFKNSFAGKFYAYPGIKYLSNKAGERTTAFSQTKPSYISDEMFSQSLIQILMDKGSGTSEMEKIRFCLKFNTHHIQPSTLKHLDDMADKAGNDVNVFKESLKNWYNETQDRATGWYKRKLQLMLFWLGFIIAAVFNVDSIRIARILSKDKEARRQLVTMGIELAKDSARYEDFLGADGDSVHTKAILDSGYVRVQKDINEANLVLGLGWGTDLLTREKVCILDSGSKKYNQLSKDTVELFENKQAEVDNIRKLLRRISFETDSINRHIYKLISDTASINLDLLSSEVAYPGIVNQLKKDTSGNRERKLDSLQKATDSFQKKMQAALDSTKSLINSSRKNLVLLATQDTSAILLDQLAVKQLDSIANRIKRVTGKNFVVINNVGYDKNNNLVVTGRVKCGWFDRFLYVLGRIIHPAIFIGLFITGLMLSLGAPFWFDLLKKLVAIRGSGIKPEEKKENPNKPAILDGINNRNAVVAPVAPIKAATGDIYDAAIKLYGPAIRKIPGVKSVVKGISNNSTCVQVNVADNPARTEVLNQFPLLTMGTTNLAPVVVISGNPVTHQSNKGVIKIKSGLNGAGSLGCVLKEKDAEAFHLLSCWHVLKGDTNYDADDNSPTILDENDAELASRWAGGIQGAFDFSIAECLPGASFRDNSFLKSQMGLNKNAIIKVRPVSDVDINSRIGVKFYDCISQNACIQQGIIYTDSAEVEILYADKPRIVEDILVLTRSVQNQTAISQPGNSGSIVFDTKNNAIAMIIGGDDMYTYAVRLSGILSLHDEMKLA